VSGFDAGEALDLLGKVLEDLATVHGRLGPLSRWSEDDEPFGLAVWLLTGKAIGLSNAAACHWRAGFTTEADPTVRLVYEIDILLRAFRYDEDHLHEWLADTWLPPRSSRATLLGPERDEVEAAFEDSEEIAQIRRALAEDRVRGPGRAQVVRLVREFDETTELLRLGSRRVNHTIRRRQATRERLGALVAQAYSDLSANTHHRRGPIEKSLQMGAFTYGPVSVGSDAEYLRTRILIVCHTLDFAVRWAQDAEARRSVETRWASARLLRLRRISRRASA
jgi:hypothetical protein